MKSASSSHHHYYLQALATLGEEYLELYYPTQQLPAMYSY